MFYHPHLPSTIFSHHKGTSCISLVCFTILYFFTFPLLNCSSPIFHIANFQSTTQQTLLLWEVPQFLLNGLGTSQNCQSPLCLFYRGLITLATAHPCLFPPLDYEFFKNKDYILFIIVFLA